VTAKAPGSPGLRKLGNAPIADPQRGGPGRQVTEVLAKAPGDRESAGLPHSAAMTRKLGGAPMAGPQKVTAKGPMGGWGCLHVASFNLA